MTCETGCYEIDIEACEDIKLKAGLTPGTDFFLIIGKLNKNNLYQFLLHSDGDGILTLDMSKLPDGYFTPGNYYKIELRTGADYLVKAPMTFKTVEYDCVLIRLINILVEESDTSPINVIQ